MNKPIEKYIKTKCGITKYHRLKVLSKKSIINKLRFFWFVSFGTLRDIFR